MTNEIVKQKTPEIMQWTLDNGENLQITLDDAKNIAGNPNVTAKEFYMLCQICKPHKLNPFLKDAFLIKYGNAPAQIITGKNSVVKIASRNKNYGGFEAGVIVLDNNKKIVHREGAMVYDGETLVGGWGRVYKKDVSKPVYNEVSIKEYIGKDKQGNVNRQWREKPATMIRKVGFVQSHREAFPEDLNNIYDEAELGAIERGREDTKNKAKDRVAEIFSKKKNETIEDAEFTEVKEAKEDYKNEADKTEENKPDILSNELKIYIKSLKISDEKINELFEKNNVSSFEELTDEVKQKCIDRLKHKYEALKKEKIEGQQEKIDKTNKTEEAIQDSFDLSPEDDPFNDKYKGDER